MKKVFFISTLLAIFLIATSSVTEAYASGSVDYEKAPLVNLNNDGNFYRPVDENSSSHFSPQIIVYYYEWKITGKKYTATHYSGWRAGPSGDGPATLTLSDSTSVDRGFTNTISGQYPVGAGTIAASLGVTLNVTKTYGTSYSIYIPNKVHRQIIFRSVYNVYTVTQREYMVLGGTGAAPVPMNNYKTATVNVFSHWDYSWR
ncbi:hypothetical protein [Sporolactobacillus pectinivorans]|uniref:hypothetical protein n=1 Tax=Sporolactobacillus pectinivorans TaxID=1591408 RepID=UPI000C2604A8|nr:hypothetical protein [Sporolactobacillus pectinivorans]